MIGFSFIPYDYPTEIFWSYKIAHPQGGSGVGDGTLCSLEDIAMAY